jgi:hypothetical protein
VLSHNHGSGRGTRVVTRGEHGGISTFLLLNAELSEVGGAPLTPQPAPRLGGDHITRLP